MAIVLGTDKYAKANLTTPLNIDDAGAGDFSIAFFIKVLSYTDSAFHVNLYNSAGSFESSGVFTRATPEIVGRARGAGGTAADSVDATPPAVGGWFPAVLRWDKSINTSELFISGVSQGAVFGNPDPSSLDTFGLGVVATSGGLLAACDSKITYARVWTRHLTSAEVDAFSTATSEADINAISSTDLIHASALVSDATVTTGNALTVTGATFDTDSPFAASGPTLSSVPATAFPGQSRTVTGTGFGATQGTGGLTIGGVTQTITSWSDTSITFTTVLGTNNYGTGKALEVTTDAATTVSDTIELLADTANGFGYVDMSSPNTTDESSVAFGATPTVVTGDQFEWEDFNNLGNLTVDAQGFVTNVDTEGTFRGRFWDATDQAWGAVEAIEVAEGGDLWPYGKGINPAAPQTWTWGRRHPKTNMRVRIYK